MGRLQPLKGFRSKEYQLISNLGGGMDLQTSDETIPDNRLRLVMNMTNNRQGVLSKRKGHQDTNVTGLINQFLNIPEVNSTDIYSLEITGKLNNVDIVGPTLLGTLLQNFVYMNDDEVQITGTTNFEKLKYSKIVANYVIKDNKLLSQLKEFGLPTAANINKFVNGELEFFTVFSGDAYFAATQASEGVLRDYKSLKMVRVYLEYNKSLNKFILKYAINSTNGSTGTMVYYKLKNELYNENTLNLADFNNNIYMVTGYNLFKIDLSSFFSPIVDLYVNENSYKPNAIEATRIGFNILATNPLSWVSAGSGTADVIKGVYLTHIVNGNSEPTLTIPVNKEFKIHVLRTGTTALAKPQYRPNNGETDITINPYKDFDGSYDVTGTIFTVTSFNLEGAFEVKIAYNPVGSTTPYIGYFDTGINSDKTVGLVADVKNLVKSSLYCKVIGTQLVLYGGHGYIFFSEYDTFNYFPNYFYVYATERYDDEVVSINYFRQYYAIFTKYMIKKLTGTFGSDNFAISNLNDFTGCNNQHTIKQVQNSLFFTNNDGLYRLKQGYMGEGTENIEKIDAVLANFFRGKRIDNAIVLGDKYILSANYSEYIAYDFIRDTFEYYANGSIENAFGVSPLFQNNLDMTQSFLFYKEPNQRLQILDFLGEKGGRISTENEVVVYTDSIYPFASAIETPSLHLGYPTNTKKFKQLVVKLTNQSIEGEEVAENQIIPLYVTVKVDDNVIISPKNYQIEIDQETNTVYYYETYVSNGEIRKGGLLGDMELGTDILGNKPSQILKLNINSQGKNISVAISDTYLDGDIIEPTNTNPFDITAVGFVYKVKKVREG